MKKSVLVFLFLLKFITILQGQISPQRNVTLNFIKDNFKENEYSNKHIDSNYLWQARAALLYYPILKDAKIKIRVRKSKTPLTARPRIWAIFQRPSQRKYLITISSETTGRLEPILLKNLSFNAQIGVLGHEMSHIVDFHQRKGLFFILLAAMHLNRKAIDKFENDTDKRCIEHGLGYQLLDWSTEVRTKLKITQWNGKKTGDVLTRERYMSPESIKKYLKY
jgi:Zn-dependent protease with chaperone function